MSNDDKEFVINVALFVSMNTYYANDNLTMGFLSGILMGCFMLGGVFLRAHRATMKQMQEEKQNEKT